MTDLRQKLLDELKSILPSAGLSAVKVGESHNIKESDVIRGSAFVRLYSALKCIAGLKYVLSSVRSFVL